MADELSKSISKMPYSYRVNASTASIKSNYEKYEGEKVSIAGRVMAIRKSGKLIVSPPQ